MPIERVIKVTADVGDAVIEIKDLFNTMVDEQEKAIKNQDVLNDNVKELGETAKSSEKGVKSLAKGFKGVGLAIKAMGVGLVLQAFAVLKDLFSQNQEVVDALATAFQGLSIIFNDMFSFVMDNAGTVIDYFKDLFENPTEHLKAFGQAIKDNIIERFVSAIEVTKLLSQALIDLFSGDFEGALDNLKEAGKEAVDVMTGVDDSLDKAVDLTKDLIEAGSEYASNVYDQAKANVELAKASEIAAAQQGLLLEMYNGQIEAQRQIRDADLNSLPERIKANEKINELLEAQSVALLKQADAQIVAAQIQFSLNQSVENEIALIEAKTNKLAVLNGIEGQRSEQLANENALKREQIDLDNSISDAEKERQIAKLNAQAENDENEISRLERLAEIYEIEQELAENDLERKREIYKEGTQARVDAEQEYLTKKQEIDARAEKNSIELAKKQEQLDIAVKDAKIDTALQASRLIRTIAGEGSKIAKGLAVAEATFSGFRAVQSTFASASLSPITTVFPAYPFIQAGLAGAFSAATIGKLLSADESGQSAPDFGAGGGGGSAPEVSAPSFNLVRGTEGNQIAESVAGDKDPIKAYVVTSDVSSGQEFDRDVIEGSTF